MEPNFDIQLYRKYNQDLRSLNDEELLYHFEELGKYQMRVYYQPSFFKKSKVLIFSTKFGHYISLVVQYLLFKNFSLSEIVYDINPNLPNLHIILFPQKVKVFPKNYIIYQLEQKNISKWIDKKFELAILYSIKTWDYSQSNIDKFPEIIKKKMMYFPIPLIPINFLDYRVNLNDNPENDILFYGSMNQIREKKLNYLQQKLYPKYNIRITNKFGKELIDEILNSKIILNIHFYENAILETCRLNESLSCEKLVISEKPDMIDITNYNIYEDLVIFVDTIDEMYEKIVESLESNNTSVKFRYEQISNDIPNFENQTENLISNVL
jgi:hypothetical protein